MASARPCNRPPTPAPKPKDSPVSVNTPRSGSYTPRWIRFCPTSAIASWIPSSIAALPTRPNGALSVAWEIFRTILPLSSSATSSALVPSTFLKRPTILAGPNISRAPGIVPSPAALLISSSVAPAATARWAASPAPAVIPVRAPAARPTAPKGAAARKGTVEPTPRTRSR